LLSVGDSADGVRTGLLRQGQVRESFALQLPQQMIGEGVSRVFGSSLALDLAVDRGGDSRDAFDCHGLRE
jgi:hypothetical protein